MASHPHSQSQSHSHSRLNPRVKPFPGYLPDPIAPPSQPNSSPPLTTTSTATSSPSSGSGTTRASTHTSTPFPYSVLQPPETKVQPVKEFGYGWSSSTIQAQAQAPRVPLGNRIGPASTSVSITEPTPDPLIIPSRARSPSVPVLPSEAYFGLGNGQNNETGHGNQHPSLDHALWHRQSTGRVPFPTSHRTPTSAGLAPRQYTHLTLLNHYPSVPSLTNEYKPVHDDDRERERALGYTPAPPPPPSLTPRYSSPNVNRWRHGVLGDPVEEEGDEDVFLSSLGNTNTNTNSNSPTLTSPRSVQGLVAQATKTPTLAPEYTQSRNIYMSSVPAHTTEKDIYDQASQYGEILSLKLDRATLAGSRAFVMFREVNAAHQFYSVLKRSGVQCEMAKEDYTTVHKSLEDPTSANLYLQGFLPEDDIDFCRSVLAPGRVISHSRPTDAQGRPRGILMARLESRAQADEAISRLNDKWVHPLTQQKLQVRIADSEQQKMYKRNNDLKRDDKFPSMPNIRHHQAPKILNLKYSHDREWSSPPPLALHRQISRETSLASIPSPTTVAFPGHANVGSTLPPPSPGYYHRQKSSTFSTGPGSAEWVSRQGWIPGTGLVAGAGSGMGSIHVQGRAAGSGGGGGGQAQGRGVGGQGYGHEYGGYHDDGLEVEFEDARHYFGSKFPATDPSSVAF